MRFLVFIFLLNLSAVFAQTSDRKIDPAVWMKSVDQLELEVQWDGKHPEGLKEIERLARLEVLNNQDPIHDSIVLLQVAKEYCFHNELYSEELFRELKLLALYSGYLSDGDLEALNSKVGDVYYRFGNFELAKDFFEKSLTYNPAGGTSYVNGRIGRCFLDMGNFDLATLYFRKAYAVSTNNSDRVSNLNSLGFTEYLNKDFDKADYYYQRALGLFSQEHQNIDSIQYYIIQSNLASVYLASGEFDKGQEKLERIISRCKDRFKRYTWFEIEVYQKLVNHLIEIKASGEVGAVIQNLRNIFRYSGTDNVKLNYLESELYYALLCKGSEDVRTAFSKYDVARKEYQTYLNENRVIIGKMQYDLFTEQLNDSKASLDLKNSFEKNLQKTNKRLVVATLIASGLLILAVILSFWYIRQKRGEQSRKEDLLKLKEDLLAEKERATELQAEVYREELKNKKYELSQLLGEAELHSDLYDEIHGRLGKLRVNGGDEGGEIAQLLQFIKSIGKTDEINHLISNNPELIDVRFKERIEKQFPDLSASELQIVVFVKLRLSNKEMAQIKNVETSSIRIFKSRLKKKMNIPKDESLSDYIEGLK